MCFLVTLSENSSKIGIDRIIFLYNLHLIPAQTGNRIIAICLGDDEFLVILASSLVILVKEGCPDNFWVKQKIKMWFFFSIFLRKNS